MSTPSPRLSAADRLKQVPAPPRSPSERARDLIFRYQGAQRVALILGVVFTLVGLGFAVGFGAGIPAEVALSLAGREVTGVVTGTSLRTNIRVNGRHPTAIEVRYSLDSGESPALEADPALAGDEARTASVSTLDGETIRAATPGAPVALEVVPWRPQWVRLRGGSYSLLGYYALLLLIVPAAALVVTFLAVRSNRREIEAFTRGEPVLARVVFRGQDRRVRMNRKHPYKVAWEFKVGERTYEGSLTNMSETALGDLMSADEIPVLYDPADPKINTAYVE